MGVRLSRRGFLASATALAAVQAADMIGAQAEAAVLRGKIRGAATPVYGAGEVVMRQTQDKMVNAAGLDDWLATIPAENDITVQVSAGAPTLKVLYLEDPDYWQTGAHQPRVWVKRELISFFAWSPQVVASTSGASVGSSVGTWTFTAKSGADETGSNSVFVMTFHVSSAPRHTTADDKYPIGPRSRAGYGGFPLAALPGSPGDKSIAAQSTPGAFAIFTETNCVAWAGTYGSATKTIGTPALGDYTVTINDAVLGQSWTVLFDCRTEIRNCAPRPGVDTPTASQLCTIVTEAGQFYGDVMVGNDGAFPGIQTTRTATYGVNPATGVTAPTQHFNEGWMATGPLTFPATADAGIVTRPAGLVTLTSLNPLGCTIRSDTGVNSGNLVCNESILGRHYMHITGTKGPIFPACTFSGSTSQAWLYYTHNSPCAGAIGSMSFNQKSDRQKNFVVLDNYHNGKLGGQGSFGVVGQDCIHVGSLYDSLREVDASKTFVYNQTNGQDRSENAWNVVKSLKTGNQAHVDAFQPALAITPAGASDYGDKPAGSTVEQFFIGNINILGEPNRVTQATIDGGFASPGDLGKPYQANQGMFMGQDSTSYRGPVQTGAGGWPIYHKLRFVGCFGCDISRWSMNLPALGPGAVIGNNTKVTDVGVLKAWADGVVPPGGGVSGPPVGWGSGQTGFISNDQINVAYPTAVLRFCLVPGWPIGNDLMWSGADDMTRTTNYSAGLEPSISTDPTAYAATIAAYAALFENPFLHNGLGVEGGLCLANIVQAWTPKAGTTPRNLLIGAFHPKSAHVIDHRRRTVATALLEFAA